jgi:hypothetical protein
MNASVSSLTRFARPSIGIMLVFAALAGVAPGPGVRAADPSPQSVAVASPVASEAPKTMCESAADLRMYVGFLQDQSIKEDGLLPVMVGVVASLSEARTLAGLVQETYRPLIDDLVNSLTDLEFAVRHIRDQGTLGSGLVQLGQAITVVGTKLDALSSTLREPCLVAAPGSSPLPAASASPAA